MITVTYKDNRDGNLKKLVFTKDEVGNKEYLFEKDVAEKLTKEGDKCSKNDFTVIMNSQTKTIK